MTVVLRPPQQFDPIDSIPLLGALGAALTLSSRYGIMAQLRWPNDVVFQERKLGGALAESKFRGNTLEYVLLGLGLNVNFHSSLITTGAVRSITTLDILGSDIDRAEVISHILLELEQLYEQVRSGEFSKVLATLRENESSRGNRLTVQFGSETLTGVFEDFETLTTVRIREDSGHVRKIETSSVIVAEYLDV
jgi:BirA family biotin operon repressor/biotin-[acetyl-CoA-carboxylase] ligase